MWILIVLSIALITVFSILTTRLWNKYYRDVYGQAKNKPNAFKSFVVDAERSKGEAALRQTIDKVVGESKNNEYIHVSPKFNNIEDAINYKIPPEIQAKVDAIHQDMIKEQNALFDNLLNEFAPAFDAQGIDDRIKELSLILPIGSFSGIIAEDGSKIMIGENVLLGKNATVARRISWNSDMLCMMIGPNPAIDLIGANRGHLCLIVIPNEPKTC